MEQSKSYQEGFDAGFAKLTDSDRFDDPEYLEGAIAGALHWDRFIASTEDHGPEFVQSLAQKTQSAQISIKLMQLERLREGELASAPRAHWPFDESFFEQPNVKGVELRYTALC